MSSRKTLRERVYDGGAIIVALNQTWQAYEAQNLEPGSENWKDFDDMRRRLVNDVRLNWAKITGLDPREFPYTPKSIHRHWTKARKSPASRV